MLHLFIAKCRILALTSLVLVVAGCASLDRMPISEEEIVAGAPYGIEEVRVWGDGLSPAEIDAILTRQIARARLVHADSLASGGKISETILALSGGGPDGAFGAGLLAGWTERGDRPEFDVVTGVSTGAIIGLFAFLGPEYDSLLREFYTQYRTEDLIEPALFSALRGATSLTDASGYEGLINKYITDDVVTRLAQEAARGRVFLIGTTNLDAARPVIWNVTRVAASGHPNAKALIRAIVRASSAIPAVFPPVVIPVTTADGRTVDELHVDGGATAQVMVVSPEFSITQVDEAFGAKINRELFVVVNNSIRKPYDPVELGVLSIAERATSSLLSGAGSGDIYQIYTLAQRDGVGFNLVSIPATFDLEPTETFDPVYMGALYELGLEYGRAGDQWTNVPPNFATR